MNYILRAASRSYNCNIFFKIKREIKRMSLLERGGDECDNLIFLSFKTGSFKMRVKLVNFTNFPNS